MNYLGMAFRDANDPAAPVTIVEASVSGAGVAVEYKGLAINVENVNGNLVAYVVEADGSEHLMCTITPKGAITYA